MNFQRIKLFLLKCSNTCFRVDEALVFHLQLRQGVCQKNSANMVKLYVQFSREPFLQAKMLFCCSKKLFNAPSHFISFNMLRRFCEMGCSLKNDRFLAMFIYSPLSCDMQIKLTPFHKNSASHLPAFWTQFFDFSNCYALTFV